jgi:hypothetical protein
LPASGNAARLQIMLHCGSLTLTGATVRLKSNLIAGIKHMPVSFHADPRSGA